MKYGILFSPFDIKPDGERIARVANTYHPGSEIVNDPTRTWTNNGNYTILNDFDFSQINVTVNVTTIWYKVADTVYTQIEADPDYFILFTSDDETTDFDNKGQDKIKPPRLVQLVNYLLANGLTQEQIDAVKDNTQNIKEIIDNFEIYLQTIAPAP